MGLSGCRWTNVAGGGTLVKRLACDGRLATLGLMSATFWRVDWHSTGDQHDTKAARRTSAPLMCSFKN